MQGEPIHRYTTSSLEEFAAACLGHYGVSRDDAMVAASALVATDAHGTHSHGLALLERYCRQLEHGGINASASLKVERDFAATALLDGDAGLGQVVASKAMAMAITKARDYGIGMVSVRNSHHFGAAGHYANIATGHQFIGFAGTNAGVTMTLPGGTKRLIGNNPYAVAIPTESGGSYVLDTAMSVASGGTVLRKAAAGEPVPLGWLVDEVGQETTDPSTYARGGALLPIGGHKGFAMALFNEILSGVLSGAATTTQINVAQTAPQLPANVGHLLIALNVEAVRDVGAFWLDLSALTTRLEAEAEAAGVSFYWPGSGRQSKSREAATAGVALPTDVLESLTRLAGRLELSLPLGLRIA